MKVLRVVLMGLLMGSCVGQNGQSATDLVPGCTNSSNYNCVLAPTTPPVMVLPASYYFPKTCPSNGATIKIEQDILAVCVEGTWHRWPEPGTAQFTPASR